MITLDRNHFGFQRAGAARERKEGGGPGNRGEERSQARANLNGGELGGNKQSQGEVMEGGGLQARANLNGGELDKEPCLIEKKGKQQGHDKGGKQMMTLSPRTGLNGGEREQEQVKKTGGGKV